MKKIKFYNSKILDIKIYLSVKDFKVFISRIRELEILDGKDLQEGG